MFCWCKVLLPTCPCWRQPAHSDYGEDAGVLLNSVIYAVCVHHVSVLYRIIYANNEHKFSSELKPTHISWNENDVGGLETGYHSHKGGCGIVVVCDEDCDFLPHCFHRLDDIGQHTRLQPGQKQDKWAQNKSNYCSILTKRTTRMLTTVLQRQTKYCKDKTDDQISMINALIDNGQANVDILA